MSNTAAVLIALAAVTVGIAVYVGIYFALVFLGAPKWAALAIVVVTAVFMNKR